MKKKQTRLTILIIVGVLIIGIVLAGIYFNKIINPEEKNETNNDVQIPNPAGVYCMKLGYEMRLNETSDGQQGICIFLDGTECDEWDFFRGKCGQQWSYCNKQGYDQKDLKQNEGWFKGGICINKDTREEIGNVFDLMKLGGERKNNSEIYTGGVILDTTIGIADISVIYCTEMGYKGKTLKNKNGDYTICIFPDETECDTWDFFRGKCGQQWSYCNKQGYDQKDLKQNEGWFKGGICINKDTREEIGGLYDLMDLKKKSSCKN